MKQAFRSLANTNYRLWAIGAIISNIGTWLQRTAQDWIVIAELSDKNASAVGMVVALQFLPQIFLLPLTGWAADRLDRRKLLITTQILMAILAMVLGSLALSGHIQLWQVYVCALLLGCVTAFDAPARHAFVSDLVSEEDLPNAVSLNSLSFNAARMVGPAIAGIIIASLGSGWGFISNAISFIPVIVIMMMLKVKPCCAGTETVQEGSQSRQTLFDGFRYIWSHPEMTVILIMVSLISMFGMNFPVYLSAMTVHVFTGGSEQYGLLTSIMAIGSITGALVTAMRLKPDLRFLTGSMAAFGVACLVASVMPDFWMFALALIAVGTTAQLFTTSSNSLTQISTDRKLRGRVMAIFLSTALGGTALGGPVIGWISDSFSPRWAMAFSGLAAIAATLIGALFLYRQQLAKVPIADSSVS